MYSSLCLAAALFTSLATSSTIPSSILSKRQSLAPIKYAALGDSFGSGHGAGLFIPEEQGSDGNNNKCARMTGSYPYQTHQFLSREITDFAFYACSGGLMKNVDEQVSALLGGKFDDISLSISGNDFAFGKAVEFCVYPYKGMTNEGADAQTTCNDNLNAAETAIKGEDKWAEFRSKVQLIQQNLNDGGHIYITGYAKFFSPGGTSSDTCAGRSFFRSDLLNKFFAKLNMRWEIRKWMNDLVEEVNRRIQTDVVEELGGENARIHFIDIDKAFEGKRFCEPGKNPWGEGQDDVWFNDLSTQLQVGDKEPWEGPAFPDSDLWVASGTLSGEGADQIPNDEFGRGIKDNFQKASAFHPKSVAHKSTAAQLTFDMLTKSTNFADGSLVTGPDKICMGFSPGGGDECFDVPQGCVALKPIDNTVPQIFCQDGRQL